MRIAPADGVVSLTLSIAAALALALLAAGTALAVPSDPTVAPSRETEPVMLTGASFPNWAVPADASAKAPSIDGKRCEGAGLIGDHPPVTSSAACTHNQYEQPELSTGERAGLAGTPTDRLLGYHWDGHRFEQIPFQVDQVFDRYLSNNNSGFSFYSETDKHTSYAFDREGFRWTGQDPADPCLATSASEVARDPVPGLDTDDELVFMASDAGAEAPAGTPLPAGVDGAFRVAVTDPHNRGAIGYAYVMRATADGPRPAFDATNGYVRYRRDSDADRYLFSESSFENYGAAAAGAYFDPADGRCHSNPAEFKQRRPADGAIVTTPRYRFRYDGRWLMTGLRVSAADDWSYGPDLIDQWKARAFQQRPGGNTPCCGFEEEVNNWGGSSILLGERSGPVRTIRETWGADSGTNVVRRETFYREEVRQASFLRVHVIPPADGIYAQWDYNAGRVSRYFNAFTSAGVPIDGQDDEAFGNDFLHAGADGISYDPSTPGLPTITVGDPKPGCRGRPVPQLPPPPNPTCLHNDVDTPDVLFSGPNAALGWEEVAGLNGTLVMRSTIHQVTPAGVAQGLVAVPYYRDDSCFDDGTGSNPGPHLRPRGADSPERPCWIPGDGVPAGDSAVAFRQGSIGTHGLHLLLVAESDNATLTEPIDEIDGEQRIVVLRPTLENVGEGYGRAFEKPLLALVTPAPDLPRAKLGVPGGAPGGGNGGNNGGNGGTNGGTNGGNGGFPPPGNPPQQGPSSPGSTPGPGPGGGQPGSGRGGGSKVESQGRRRKSNRRRASRRRSAARERARCRHLKSEVKRERCLRRAKRESRKQR